MARNVEGSARITIPSDTARVIVMTPVDGKVSYDGMHTLVDGVVVDYDNGRVARPSPPPCATLPDNSRTIYADRATITVDGDPGDWQRFTAIPSRSTPRVEARSRRRCVMRGTMIISTS